MNARRDVLIQIFARTPVAGQVKTRLIPALGAAGAAALYLRLLRRTVAAARAAAPGAVELWCTPDCAHPRIADFADLPCREQAGADLGARMAHALADGLQRARRVVLVGSDCPGLDAAGLRVALAALAGHEVVLGPAEDGGYVLVGLRRPADIFTGIDWGSERVLAQTRQRLRAQGLRWHELPVLWDLDRPADLARYQNS